MKKFAIVGKGFIYPRHKQAIEKLGGKIVLTCDIDKNKKADFVDWVEMFNSSKFNEVNYVSVCVPNYLHSVICREALLKGKKVLCEKPLSINGIMGMKDVKTVLQLRYHPKLQEKKSRERYGLKQRCIVIRSIGEVGKGTRRNQAGLCIILVFIILI